MPRWRDLWSFAHSAVRVVFQLHFAFFDWVVHFQKGLLFYCFAASVSGAAFRSRLI